MVKLKVESREVLGKTLNGLRKTGFIPAVLYGKNIESMSLAVPKKAFIKVHEEAGENAIIDLELPDNKTSQVIVRDTQYNPISDEIIHVDFFAPRMDKKIEAKVELEYIGESPAVKEQGGILIKSVDELEIRCLPKDLPEIVEVDISGLKNFDENIKVKDLKISDKVEVMADPETVVAVISAPRSEEELKGLEEKVEEDVTKVEVEGEKKEEEATEGEAPEAEKAPTEEKQSK